MMVVPALALAAMLAVGDPLAEAQQAFAQGNYEGAEQLALQAAQPPRLGAALYLVGLARFRAGRPADALEAFDAAGRAEDAPERAQWSFNRGACLYALARFDEAEQAFLEATADEALAQVAWVNAGFAALDAGAPERAAQWAARAKAGASERELALVEDLLSGIAGAQGRSESEGDEAYRQGLVSFDAGRFEEARAQFLRAAKLEPSSGRAWLMAGASAYRMDDRAAAREDVTSALALPLEPRDQEIARDYLDRLSFGLRANGRGPAASVATGGGFDSNVLQIGVAQRDVLTGTETGSAFAEVGLGLVARFRLSDSVFAELSYGGSQRAYALASVRDYSLQLHRADAAVELDVTRRFRLGVSSGGDLFFTGTSAFRGLQASAGASAWFVLDESDVTSTRLDVSIARKVGLVSEFSYLTGGRLDATLSQSVRLRSLGMTAWYRYREDRIGTLVQQASSGDTSGTSQEYVIPFAWTGHAAGASARWELGERWEASLSAGVEWRNYLSESSLRNQAADGSVEEWGRRRRKDVRFVLGPAVSARLTEHLQLTVRYDLLVNESNVDTRLADPANACTAPEYSCHRYDYTNGNYHKHLPMLELGATW
ncbi:tetratricopeptide repeat protein [Hyalangium rubrum]|uniref:Tetratricopeptide repeat protein n=1 Tax=Hyalangium rubrum TaxID=3103134 RepID=A0ABU5GUU7_9BACT|nr:tetratricopeptide repeat protein [Hyalangium sp. s54d21]MDY7224957.1 tetratricopeptide repeat protein [Hyalangium sp. s54d21]